MENMFCWFKCSWKNSLNINVWIVHPEGEYIEENLNGYTATPNGATSILFEAQIPLQPYADKM